MSDTPTRNAKLVQFLNEAYAKEKQLETSLQTHAEATPRDDYARRLKDHLKETKSHAAQVARRIKQLGGNPETVSIPGPDGLGHVAENVAEKLGKARRPRRPHCRRYVARARGADAPQRARRIRRRGAGDRDLHGDRLARDSRG